MLPLSLGKSQDKGLSVLCLGAHSDDIEIGCGGTMLKLVKEYSALDVTWVVFGASGERALEAHRSAEALLRETRNSRVIVKDFRDSYFPYYGEIIKDYFEQMKAEVQPDLIFTHYRHDLHQDHRLLSDLTWNTFRDHLILEYEIPKYDGDLGSPNFFVPLTSGHCRTKVEHILGYFQTQLAKQWFSSETFRAGMRLRGIECNAPQGYAEGFYARKLTILS